MIGPNLLRALSELARTNRLLIVDDEDPIPTPMDLDTYMAADEPPAIVRMTVRDAAVTAAKIAGRN